MFRGLNARVLFVMEEVEKSDLETVFYIEFIKQQIIDAGFKVFEKRLNDKEYCNTSDLE